MLSEISALLGRPQRESQRNHREKRKEKRNGEAGEGRRQYGEAVRATSQLRCALGRFTVEERVCHFSYNPVALWAVRLQP